MIRFVLLPFFFLFTTLPSLAQPNAARRDDARRDDARPISVDVCVYGGTSAGVVAAYTARKAGKSVVLIEPGRHLGGLSSGGLGQTDIGNKRAITGLARDFYRRIGRHYGRFEQWTFEPHVAENRFKQYLNEAAITPMMGYRLTAAEVRSGVIQSITLEPSEGSGNAGAAIQSPVIQAKQFIDCTYEGDLMARAGVSYVVGREANHQYGETYNGVQLREHHQFPNGVDPYREPGNPASGLLWGISPETLQPNGTGDKKLQAYNFRLCLTNNPANRIPITRPAGYDSTRYELLLRQIAIEKPKVINWGVMHIADMPNQKTDINNKGAFSTDMIGMNYDYAEASYDRRQQIIREHELYTKGFLYFVGNDPRVPEHLRQDMQQWGYPKDEYVDNGHFSPQLYVREARRLVGEYVMTQANCEGKTTVTDGVGLAAYTMDSHNCQRIVIEKDGRKMVKNEGDVQIGGFPPYPVSYRSLVPKRGECRNLLVPVCLSATHIAYGSIRMEPVFMVLAQSAALAASMAIDSRRAVQDIDVVALQRRLATDPLMNGSPAEILVDNDDSGRVELRGAWTRVTKGDKYGLSAFVDDSRGAVPKWVRYKPALPRATQYEVLLYNPARQGGGNPSAPTRQAENASRVRVNVVAGGKTTARTINQQEQSYDWISLGQHRLAPGDYVELTNQQADGNVVADAVLFRPVR